MKKILIPIAVTAILLAFPATAMATTKAPCNSDKPAKASPTTVTQPSSVQQKPTSTTVKATSSSTSTSTTIKEKPCQTSTTLRTNAVPTTTVPKSTTTAKLAGAVVTLSTSTSLPQDDSINRYGTGAIGVAVGSPITVTKAASVTAPGLAVTGMDASNWASLGLGLLLIGGLSLWRAWVRRQAIEGKKARFES